MGDHEASTRAAGNNGGIEDDQQSLTVTVALELDDGTESVGDAIEKGRCAKRVVANVGSADSFFYDNNNREVARNGGLLEEQTENYRVGADGGYEDAETVKDVLDLRIGPPTRARDVCPRVEPMLTVADLTPEVVRVIELRLNPCAIGSVKNWEFIGADLGASMVDIQNLRHRESPTAVLLKTFSSIPLNRLLDILCTMNRVDVLISIEKLIRALKSPPQNRSKAATTYSNNSTISLDINSLTGNIGFTRTFLPFNETVRRLLDDRSENRRFIFIIHHEAKESRDLRKLHKYFMHNLRKNGEMVPAAPEILDVDDCFDESNMYDTMQAIFARAHQVVVVFSGDYLEHVVNYHHTTITGPVAADYVRVKRALHAHTNDEYLRNGMRNYRFRPVFLGPETADRVPSGWPTNTISYHFPAQFQALCQRLFVAVEPTTNPLNYNSENLNNTQFASYTKSHPR